MITHHVHEALTQVREIQLAVLDRIRFKGFSGPTRALSGTMALFAAAFMSTPFYPQTPHAHFVGWCTVLVMALLLNSSALAYWFWRDPLVNRELRRLTPVLDVIPPLFVGGILTAVLVLNGQRDLLFGTWMLMFGLTNLASRRVLPRTICLVGLFYMVAGIIWLFAPNPSFLNPWPMGLVFFTGEWAGGMILYIDDKRLEKEYIRNYETEDHRAEDSAK